MRIIPAVDIKNGKCVRLTQGKEELVTVYSEDPVEMALRWQDEGAKLLHVVDLDGAFKGELQNEKVIFEIAGKLDIDVEIGGGIRTVEQIRRLIEGGISKVIIGTQAVVNRDFLQEAVSQWPESVVVGIDSSNGKVAIKGWKVVTDKDAVMLAMDMEHIGVRRLIVTDVVTDGTLIGPNTDVIKRIVGALSVPVTVAGGVSSMEDLRKLRRLCLDNLDGVILGKSLYTNKIVLSRAIEEFEEE